MKYHIVTFLIGAFVALSAAAMARGEFDNLQEMSQSSFPCQEDEVLAYAPQFGADSVGCIHVSDIEPDTGEYIGGFN